MLGLLGKVLLPVAVSANVLFVLIDITVDNVIAVGSAEGVLERKVENLIVLTKEPGVCLAACESCAMYSRLLTCANADSLSVNCVANRVRLSVFKCDKSNYKIAKCALGHILVCGYEIGKKLLVDLKIVSSLLEGNAVNLLALLSGGNVVGIDLYDIVIALALCLEDLKCLGLVAGSDDTVGYLALEHKCCGNVANVGERYPVAK